MKRLMGNHDRHQVVLLGLVDTGYGVVRSLYLRGIRIIAFERNREVWRHPEIKSSLCTVRHVVSDDDLLMKLRLVSTSLGYKPFLFMSSDVEVSFVNRNLEELREYYLFDFPEADTVRLLLEKTRFCKFAPKYDFLIPRTICTDSYEDIEVCIREVAFPCLVKPVWRTREWIAARLPKVLCFKDRGDFETAIRKICSIEQHLVIQEWIPGGDECIFFCLTYFNDKRNCVCHFTGQKIRQWRVGRGHTSCAIPADRPEIRDETLRLFELVGLSGFGSVEFKRHAGNGRFYIMEPTVGRPNHQSYLATANGVNMPYLAYCSVAGVHDMESNRCRKAVTWVDELSDVQSLFWLAKRGMLSMGQIWQTIVQPKSLRFVCRHDLKVFMYLLAGLLYRALRKMYRGVFQACALK